MSSRIVLTRARLVRRRDEREQRRRRRIDARSGDLIAGKGLPGLGIDDRAVLSDEKSPARAARRRHRGEDVERRIGVVAVVVEDEARLRVVPFETPGIFSGPPSVNVYRCWKYVGLIGRLARQRARRRVDGEPAKVIDNGRWICSFRMRPPNANPPGPPPWPNPPARSRRRQSPRRRIRRAARSALTRVRTKRLAADAKSPGERPAKRSASSELFSCPVAPTLTTDSPALSVEKPDGSGVAPEAYSSAVAPWPAVSACRPSA